MFFKKFLTLIFALFIIFIFPQRVEAQTDFFTDVVVEYKIEEDGTSTITHNFRLENATTDLYATSYNLVLDNIKPIDVLASENGNNLRTEQNSKGETTTITVFFDEAVVGK